MSRIQRQTLLSFGIIRRRATTNTEFTKLHPNLSLARACRHLHLTLFVSMLCYSIFNSYWVTVSSELCLLQMPSSVLGTSVSKAYLHFRLRHHNSSSRTPALLLFSRYDRFPASCTFSALSPVRTKTQPPTSTKSLPQHRLRQLTYLSFLCFSPL